MKKSELIYREILMDVIEGRRRVLSQSELSKSLSISLSTVSHAIKPLRSMGAVKVKKRSLEVIDGKKVLLYWASVRSLEKDIIYRTRAGSSVIGIEKSMPNDVVFGSYSAYKFMLDSVPADYSEVYVYSNDLKELKRRFPENSGVPNLFVLKKDFEKMTLGHLFVDMWNMREWYAKDFLKKLEGLLYGLLE